MSHGLKFKIMKNINKIFATVLAGVAMTACNDLNTEYLGYYVTEEQKADVLEANPDMALAGVTGIAATANMFGSVYDAHFDFGYPGVMLGMDMQGTDMVQPDVSYGVHFNYWFKYRYSNQHDVAHHVQDDFLIKRCYFYNFKRY